MITVTPSFSASGMIRRRPIAQFSMPSASDIPARLPEKTIICGIPAAATSGSSRSDSFTRRSCSLSRLKPTGIVPGPFATAQVSPKGVSVAHSFSLSSSTDRNPIADTSRQSVSSGMPP